jgi:hydrogenase nickel incorporation protein HypB
MCTTCGCSSTAEATVIDPGHFHDHGHHHHDHDHDHAHHHSHGAVVTLEQQILAKNNLLAERNRGWFAGRGILALNLMSSPGAGKTTLLERTIRDLGSALAIGVIEGDQATETDAARIRAAGCNAVQINTGTGCHLEAEMLARGLAALKPPRESVVMIENVGNLVCPALFDLGERAKVVMLSVTEGDDKPLKYPHMFRAAEVVIITKSDFLPHVEFSIDRCLANARVVNRSIRSFVLSAVTGDGVGAWYDWLNAEQSAAVKGSINRCRSRGEASARLGI